MPKEQCGAGIAQLLVNVLWVQIPDFLAEIKFNLKSRGFERAFYSFSTVRLGTFSCGCCFWVAS